MRPTVTAAKNGEPTLLLGDRMIHSRYDPTKEAEREVEAIAKDNPTAVVILGCGLGYAASAAFTLLPTAKIICVESDPEFFGMMESERGLIKDPRVYYIVGKNAQSNFDALTHALDSTSSGCIRYLTRLADLDPDHYTSIANLVGGIVEMQMESLHSMVRFGPLWWENSVRNYRAWTELPDVADWFGAFRDESVIIFAAGPTLGDDLELFASGEGGIRFAVDTALPILAEAGVRVDAVFAIDAQKLTLKHFEGLTPRILAGAPVIPPELWRTASSSVLMSLDGPHFAWFENALERTIARLKSGGSVTTFAFDLARRMAARSIVLVGADFAHRGGRRHAGGTIYEKIENDSVGRFFGSEHLKWKTSIRRDGVETEEQLAQYAQWMNWEIAATRSTVSRMRDFGLLKNVPTTSRDEIRSILSGARPTFEAPVAPTLDARLLIESFKMERAALEVALEGDPRGLAALSGFFDLIIRPYAIVSNREHLPDEIVNDLMKKLSAAAATLDEVIESHRYA